MVGKAEIMLRQYELLRNGINRCSLLRQAAVVGIFTTLIAGMGGLFALQSEPLSAGELQLGVIGVVFLVNAFGSLYLHEQHRNRRVCALCEGIAQSSPEDLMLREWSRFSKWKDNAAAEKAEDND